MRSQQPRAILIAGPTASGKSALALRFAEALGGVLINADASQVYRELKVLSARPSEEEMARVTHCLYGHVPVSERYSVARWLEEARNAVVEAESRGQVPILVGGTGLYFHVALDGISEIPPIPAEIRSEARRLFEELGPQGFREHLAALDAEAAERLPLNDRYRAIRASEVAAGTGKTLAEWHESSRRSLFDASKVMRLVLMPDREGLYAACNQRFDDMMAAGALEEVHALLALGLSPTLPAMKAVGVAELARFISGDWPLEEAVEAAKRRTRQFAKRQLTWIRGRMADWRVVNADESIAVLAVR